MLDIKSLAIIPAYNEGEKIGQVVSRNTEIGKKY